MQGDREQSTVSTLIRYALLRPDGAPFDDLKYDEYFEQYSLRKYTPLVGKSKFASAGAQPVLSFKLLSIGN